MPRPERIKEEIGWLKIVFGILIATDISLLAWLAQNFESTPNLQLAVALIAVAVVTIAVVWVNGRAYKRLEELEKL